MNTDERHQLIDALIDGDISEADFVSLEAEMLVNPEARDTYYERLKLDILLESEARDQEQPAQGSTQEKKILSFPDYHIAPRYWGAGIAAALAILGVATSLGWLAGSAKLADQSTTPAAAEPLATGYGVIAEHVGARWSDDTPSVQRGEILPQGPLALEEGLIEIDLFSGVALIVEGASDFEILSPMEVRIDSGKVRAQVPEQARGFRIHTAAGDVVDLGTEFALEVTPDHAEVHVLDGEIEWHQTDRDMQLMVKGEALRISAEAGDTTSLAHDPSRFTDFDQIDEALARGRSERRDAWLTHSSKLAADPRTVMYFPMSETSGWHRKMTDASASGINGTIVRADRVSDRWDFPSAALDFTPAGSRVRVEVAGVHRSMTFFCWARIDSLDRWYNSLFLTDGHELNEPHWQIMNDGRLFFSVKKNDSKATKEKRDKHIYYSPPIWTPAQSGQWFQIATTYDVDNRQVTHYVNGEMVSREPIADEWLVETVSIGAASIGNWSDPVYKRDDPHFAVRNLNGVIDEFAIFSAALDSDEIRALYEIGKP